MTYLVSIGAGHDFEIAVEIPLKEKLAGKIRDIATINHRTWRRVSVYSSFPSFGLSVPGKPYQR